MNQPKSVKGLANIAQLMNRSEAVAQAQESEKLKSRVDGKDQIVAKTTTALLAKIPAELRKDWDMDVRKNIVAAIREAYNLGHAAGFDQNNQVEKLLNQQYEARTKLTMPTVVAAVMEQSGMSTLTLNMDALGTTFERCRIEMDFTGEDVLYTLRHLADDKENGNG